MKVVAIIQARMGSERLPGKVLMPLCGKPVLWHIIQILKGISLIDEIIIATTTLYEDLPIVDFCEINKINFIQGSVFDVLDRFRLASIETHAEIIVRVTADNPCLDQGIITKVLKTHLKGGYDYSSNNIIRTYPRGLDTEVITKTGLKKVWENSKSIDEREHVTLFIKKNLGMFKFYNLKAENKYHRPEVRLTLDTLEDYRLLKNIYNNCYKNEPIKIDSILEYLNINPRISKINSRIKQKLINGLDY